MHTIIGFTVLAIVLVFGIIFVFSLLKTAGDYDNASEELYRNQIKYMVDMEKVEKHKKMLEEANENPEYVEKQ